MLQGYCPVLTSLYPLTKALCITAIFVCVSSLLNAQSYNPEVIAQLHKEGLELKQNGLYTTFKAAEDSLFSSHGRIYAPGTKGVTFHGYEHPNLWQLLLPVSYHLVRIEEEIQKEYDGNIVFYEHLKGIARTFNPPVDIEKNKAFNAILYLRSENIIPSISSSAHTWDEFIAGTCSTKWAKDTLKKLMKAGAPISPYLEDLGFLLITNHVHNFKSQRFKNKLYKYLFEQALAIDKFPSEQKVYQYLHYLNPKRAQQDLMNYWHSKKHGKNNSHYRYKVLYHIESFPYPDPDLAEHLKFYQTDSAFIESIYYEMLNRAILALNPSNFTEEVLSIIQRHCDDSASYHNLFNEYSVMPKLFSLNPPKAELISIVKCEGRTIGSHQLFILKYLYEQEYEGLIPTLQYLQEKSKQKRNYVLEDFLGNVMDDSRSNPFAREILESLNYSSEDQQ